MRQRSLSRILSRAMQSALIMSAGCGVNTSSYDSPVCAGGGVLSVEGLNPSKPVDYVEFRSIPTLSGGTTAVLSSTGTRCSSAPNKPMCESSYSAAMPSKGFYQHCFDACDAGALVATRGQDVVVVDSKAALDAFLAPYDTPQEALFAALTSGRYISCTDKSRGAVKQVGDGYDVVTYAGSGCGTSDPVKQYLLHVDAAGTVTEVSSYTLQPGTPGCVIGRRPDGLRSASKSRRSSDCVGRYFADNARLEAASVTAFRILRAELLLHGAPQSLVRLSTRSARDEIRHAQVVRRLARRYGGRVQGYSVRPQPPRSLEAMALENATEGCVRETFGALLGRWQAVQAKDPAVRRAMAKIARDETRHAALSWDVADWLWTKLDAAAQERVRTAQRNAIAQLRAELAVAKEPAVQELAGLPTPSQAQALLAQLEVRLWARVA